MNFFSRSPERKGWDAGKIARNAIGDAMTLAYITDENDKPYEYHSSGEHLDSNLESITYGWCESNSEKVITHLSTKYSNVFDRFLLIKTFFSRMRPFRGRWDWHACFAVRDIHGKWYVGSPANFDPTRPNHSLNTYYEGDTLRDALESFGEVEGGDWGSGDEFERLPYRPPQVEEHNGRHSTRIMHAWTIVSGRSVQYKSSFTTTVEQQNNRRRILDRFGIEAYLGLQ